MGWKWINIEGKKEFEIKSGNGNIKEYYRVGKLELKGENLNEKRKREKTIIKLIKI